MFGTPSLGVEQTHTKHETRNPKQTAGTTA